MDMQETYFDGDALLIKKNFYKLNTNNILYCKFPQQDSTKPTTFFFQRLIGLPGDTIELKDKVVYINGVPIEDTSTIKHNYLLKTKQKLESSQIIQFNLLEGCAISEINDYSFSLTKFKANSLKKNALTEKIEVELEAKNNFDITCFPYSYNYKWNMDNYGKIYIPKKNDTLILDTISICFYKKIIDTYEKNKLEIKGDSFFINKKLTAKYCVKQNYYFLLGDNRDNANDSRKWGFLPQKYIVGKSILLIKKSKR